MRAFKIAHLSAAFIVLAGLLLALLGAGTWYELQGITRSIEERERLAAGDEIREAVDNMAATVRRNTENLGKWEETKQQLVYKEFYTLWRDDRVRDSGLLPVVYRAVALYDKDGHILAQPTAGGPMPNLMPGRTGQYYSGDKATAEALYYFFPIHADPDKTILLGYGGVQFPLAAMLQQSRRFRFADIHTLKATLPARTFLEPAALSAHLLYRPLDNPSLQIFQGIFQHTLIRLIAFLIGTLIVAAWLLHRFLVRPLTAISRAIDAAQHGSASVEDKSTGRGGVQVLELEAVRRSISEYQARLNVLNLDLEKSTRQFYEQAHRDDLTGIYNRRAFDLDWRAISSQGDSRESALLLFDCDHFKAINDTYGHAVGDNVIKAIAACLVRALRTDDRLYRLGGDEFATLLRNCEPARARAIAERCWELVMSHDFRQYGLTEPVTISVGIALGHGSNTLINEMLKQADIAMYTAKRPGKGKIVVYDSSLGDLSPLVANRELSAVFEAIQNPALLQFRYQPIVSLSSNRADYVEALARLCYEGDLIGPAAIFPIVHDRRIDEEFDLAVIAAIRRDLLLPVILPVRGVSINLSAPGLVSEKVMAALLELRRAAADVTLVVEITETALITQMELATAHIQRLRQAGCKIALDDFGSGYSSLRYLATMPVDVVKFDISLIQLLAREEPRQRRVVENIAQTIRAAGYQLVAEGIETAELLETVRALGFSHAQGYHLDHLTGL